MQAAVETLETPVLAFIEGKPLTEIPLDLFIPPDALEVLLDSFSGPLDLLLYLIKKQNFNILDIPISRITKQYLQYIDIMKNRRLELAADYLVMAAVLAEIKSKMLLPDSLDMDGTDEVDPRQELVRRLQAYEEMKEAALRLDDLPRLEREFFFAVVHNDNLCVPKPKPELCLASLVEAMQSLMRQQKQFTKHAISKEQLSVRERMTDILQKLRDKGAIEFTRLLVFSEGRIGLVVSFLAILELSRQSLISITQTMLFAPIYLEINT